MKKVLFILFLLPIFLFTGCSKMYQSVEEYSEDMLRVREQLGDYTMNIKFSSQNKDTHVKSYKKGTLWKTMISNDGGKTYKMGLLYDGSEVYTIDTNTRDAVVLPINNMYRPQNPKFKKSDFIKLINPAGIFYYWDADFTFAGNVIPFRLGYKTNKNGFACHMLIYPNKDEICISDEYGVMVYAKVRSKNGESYDFFNVSKISNKSISNGKFRLPPEFKKIKIDDKLNFNQNSVIMDVTHPSNRTATGGKKIVIYK